MGGTSEKTYRNLPREKCFQEEFTEITINIYAQEEFGMKPILIILPESATVSEYCFHQMV